jgi:hypothetical protein
MKRIIRIDRAEGEVSVDANPGTGIRIKLELPHVTVAFNLNADTARKLGEGLTQAARELDGGSSP